MPLIIILIFTTLSLSLNVNAKIEPSAQDKVKAQVVAKNTIKTTNDDKEKWRKLDINKLVLMTLPHGKVVIELAPQFSPKNVEQFVRLTKEKHYDGTKFYRVIDGFVAQAGPKEGSKEANSVPFLDLEGTWPTDKNWSFTLVQDNDLFAEKTGFKEGFAVATNPSEDKAWLAHCPGIIAMGRENGPNTAASHFYIPIGQAPRYLDRIMTILGRVVYGMNHVQAITRTATIENEPKVKEVDYTPIISMKMMTDVAKEQQIHLEVEDTENAIFATKLVNRIKRKHPFFFQKPPPVLDVCQVPVLTRIVGK